MTNRSQGNTAAVRLVADLGATLVVLALVPWFIVVSPPAGAKVDEVFAWPWEVPGMEALPWLILASGLALAVVGRLRHRFDAQRMMLAAGGVALASLLGFYAVISHAATLSTMRELSSLKGGLSLTGVSVLLALVCGSYLRALLPTSPVGRLLLIGGALALLYSAFWPEPLPDLSGVESLAKMRRPPPIVDQAPWLLGLRTLHLYFDPALGKAGPLLALLAVVQMTLPFAALGALWCGLAPARRAPHDDGATLRPPRGLMAVRFYTVAYGPAALLVLFLTLLVARGTLAVMYLAMAAAFATWLSTSAHALALLAAQAPWPWWRGKSG